MAPFPRVISQLLRGRLITLTTSRMEKVAFWSYWNRHPGCEFSFSAGNASAKTTINGLKECYYGIPHTISSDQGIHFIAKELQQWAHAHQTHWCYHVPHHAEVASLVEQ